ncbi:MAG: hypothetical protein R6X22_13190 [Gemmatimonadota bacterium]
MAGEHPGAVEAGQVARQPELAAERVRLEPPGDAGRRQGLLQRGQAEGVGGGDRTTASPTGRERVYVNLEPQN